MIETKRLKLIPCELAHFEALLNDPQRIEQMLGISFADEWRALWLPFPEAIPHGYKYLMAHPDALGWWTYLFIHAADKMLVGAGGFQGKVNEEGMVEIGYAIAPVYRKRGLATEAAEGFVDYAFKHPQVKIIDAHTLPDINPSTKVLEKIGMKRIGTSHDPDEGEVWHWRLSREEYQNSSATKA